MKKRQQSYMTKMDWVGVVLSAVMLVVCLVSCGASAQDQEKAPQDLGTQQTEQPTTTEQPEETETLETEETETLESEEAETPEPEEAETPEPTPTPTAGTREGATEEEASEYIESLIQSIKDGSIHDNQSNNSNEDDIMQMEPNAGQGETSGELDDFDRANTEALMNSDGDDEDDDDDYLEPSEGLSDEEEHKASLDALAEALAKQQGKERDGTGATSHQSAPGTGDLIGIR